MNACSLSKRRLASRQVLGDSEGDMLGSMLLSEMQAMLPLAIFPIQQLRACPAHFAVIQKYGQDATTNTTTIQPRYSKSCCSLDAKNRSMLSFPKARPRVLASIQDRRATLA
jgi:hypothetical protein